LIVAQGSANEVDHWLNTAVDFGIGNPENVKRILALNIETRKMLASTIISLRNQSARTIHETPAPYSPIPSDNDNDDPEQEIL
jgi:hypothetical protein